MKASDRWQTQATRDNWTPADTTALLAEGGALLSPMATNAKTRKKLGELGIEGRILHLSADVGVAPYLGRNVTVCPLARINLCGGERGPCLDFAGRGQILPENDPILHVVHRARIRRTLRYFADRAEFFQLLHSELAALDRAATRKGLQAVARLDGTSDLGLADKLASLYPRIQFYDYTKVTARMLRHLRLPPQNYHITYSRGAGNESDCQTVLAAGGNVAVVFDTLKGDSLPANYLGAQVIDGDAHDFRYLDPRGAYIIGLRAKGRARHDTSGFVVHIGSLRMAA